MTNNGLVMITIDNFARIFEEANGEPEYEVAVDNREAEYMIVKYSDCVTFQRCGIENGSGEIRFGSLDELLSAETIDGICLKRDWDQIGSIVVNGTEVL